MAKKALVAVGGYMAEMELINGTIVLTVTGADFGEKLFEKLIKDRPQIRPLEFYGEELIK